MNLTEQRPLDPDELAGPRDVAAHLRVSRQWVYDHAKALGGMKLGGVWRFEWADVERFKNRHRTRDPLAYTELSAKRQASKRRAS